MNMPERGVGSRDKINLRLLLVSGKKYDFQFPPSTSASAIADHVFHNWPSDWTEDSLHKPEKPDVLRLLYRGKFLHRTTRLSSLDLVVGKTTVMHLVVRDKLPGDEEGVPTDTRSSRRKSTTASTDPQSCCCVLL